MTSRNAILYFAIALAIPLALSQSNWPLALYHIIVDGGCLIAWLLASFGYGAQLLAIITAAFDRAAVPPPRPVLRERAGVRAEPLPTNGLALRIATSIVFGIGIVSLITLALGLTGALNIYIAWIVIIVGIVLAIPRLLRARQRKLVIPNWMLLFAPIVGLWLYMTLLPPGVLWHDEPNAYDILEYHLQIPREWYEAHKILPLHHNVFCYFPQIAEMQSLLAMHLRGGPWEGMYLAQMMSAAMMAIAALALYGSGKMLALRGAKWMAPAFMLLPWTMLLAPICYNESCLLMFATIAISWTLVGQTFLSVAGRGTPRPESSHEHIRKWQTGMSAPPIIAGIATGFACGTKLTAGPMLLAPLFILLLINRKWNSSILYLLSSILFLCPWLIRNFLWTHNPVFPELMPLLGHGHFSQLQVTRWELAYRLAPGQSRLGELWNQILSASEFAWLLVPLALISLIKKPSRQLAIILLIQFIFWIGFTHLQGRFFVLAIPVMLLMISFLDFASIAFGAITVASVIAWLLPIHDSPLGGKISRLGTATLYAPFVGITDYSWTHPKEVNDLPKDQNLILIGDAKAFFYQRPITYRTVFDVDNTNRDLLDAWSNGAKGPTLIDPNELRRFARTYYGIPMIRDEHDAPYLAKP